VEETVVVEGCLSRTMDNVVKYAAIMVYKEQIIQIILCNALAINEKIASCGTDGRLF